MINSHECLVRSQKPITSVILLRRAEERTRVLVVGLKWTSVFFFCHCRCKMKNLSCLTQNVPGSFQVHNFSSCTERIKRLKYPFYVFIWHRKRASPASRSSELEGSGLHRKSYFSGNNRYYGYTSVFVVWLWEEPLL